MGPYRTPLDVIRIKNPCEERWSAMTGDARVRYCGVCDENVYDLSEMTRDEASALLSITESALCVRFHRRADGTLVTKDCTADRHRRSRRRRRRAAVAGAAALVLGAGGTVAASAVHRCETWDQATATPCDVNPPRDESASFPPDEDKGGYFMGMVEPVLRRAEPSEAGSTWVDPETLPRLSETRSGPRGGRGPSDPFR